MCVACLEIEGFKVFTLAAHESVKSPRECYFDGQQDIGGPGLFPRINPNQTFTFSGLGFTNFVTNFGAIYLEGVGKVAISNCEFWSIAESAVVVALAGVTLSVQNTNFYGSYDGIVLDYCEFLVDHRSHSLSYARIS